MKATDLLKKQHKEVKALFKRIEKANGAKKEIFAELAHNLVAHDAIEREIFYPACEKVQGLTDLLGESLVEHGVVEFALFNADRAQGRPDFDYKITVLREVLEHHIEEEEDDLFPSVEKSLGKARSEELCEELEQRFESAVKSDFRAPLVKNLKAVLAGAVKTGPARSNGGGRAASKKAPRAR